MEPKAVAVDIDGTITDSDKIHLGAIKQLRKLEEAGIPVILATGNKSHHIWTMEISGASGPMVCENGGVVWHPKWEILLSMQMEKS